MEGSRFVALDPLEQMVEKARDLLDALDNALASVATDKLRTSLVDALPAGDNEIGRVRLRGYDYAATVWRDLALDAEGRLLCTLQ